MKDMFFEMLDDVRMVCDDRYEVVEMLEKKLGRSLSEIEFEWVEEMVYYEEE